MNNEELDILIANAEYEPQQLKDYITNLQQKVKYYEETQTFGDYVKEVNLLVDYKSRIEKAVDYIKNQLEEKNYLNEIYTDERILKIVLNILNGRSDE